MVERSAVNRLVVGSNPTWGVLIGLVHSLRRGHLWCFPFVMDEAGDFLGQFFLDGHVCAGRVSNGNPFSSLE